MPRKNLTAKAVESLKPSSGQVDYWDKVLSGFGLRVSPGGRKTWLVMYRSPVLRHPETNKPLQRRYVLGTSETVTVADARLKARKALNAVADGRDPAEEENQRDEAPSFAKVATAYIERHAKVHKRSWRKDKRVIDRELLPRFKNWKARDIKRRDIVAMLEEIRQRAPIMANRTLEITRKLFNWAVSVDELDASPCIEIPRPAPEKVRRRTLTDDELRAFWESTAAESWRMRDVYRLRLVTAQRGVEVATMRKADRVARWWTIPPEISKNGEPHRVYLSDMAMEIIEEAERLAGDSPWVFPSVRINRKGEEGPVVHLGKAGRDIRDRTGADFRGHDLRRTASTRMTGELKISRTLVGKVLNHTDKEAAKATAAYDQYEYDAEKQAALKRWGAHLSAILQNKKPASGSNVTPLRRKGVA